MIQMFHIWNMTGVNGLFEFIWQGGGEHQTKNCWVPPKLPNILEIQAHWWWENCPTGIVLRRQSVWNVCGQWWRGHDASPRSIQEPTLVFVPCCTWSWPSHMPNRSHYFDCPLWQKLKVPAKREMAYRIYIQLSNLFY